MDMYRFHAERFFELANGIKNMQALALQMPPQMVVPRDGTEKEIAKILADCEATGLRCSVPLARRMVEDVRAGRLSMRDFEVQLAELASRINDELSTVLALRVPPDKVRFFRAPKLFGDHRFPIAESDIEEAGTCFAVGCYTACVFHLMRVAEIALRDVASDLGVPDPLGSDRNWGTMLGKLDAQIKVNDQAGDALARQRWKAQRAYYVRARALLGFVKDAWRNECMHVEGKYDEGEATRVMSTVQGVIEHLAKRP